MVLNIMRALERIRAEARTSRYRLRRDMQIGKHVRLGPGVRLKGSVKVGDYSEIGSGTSIIAAPNAAVEIGEFVFISSLCVIAARERIEIGSETMVAEFVTIRDHDHDPRHPPRSGRTLVAPVMIGSRVWLGTKVTVTRGTEIGDDAVVAANSVATRSVEREMIVGGIPARPIRRKGTGGSD